MTQSTQATKLWKFSYAVSVSPTDFEAVGKGDWKSIIQSLHIMGYDGVELAVRNPDEVSASSIKDTFESNDLCLTAVGTGQAFLSDNLSLSSEDPRIKREAVNRIMKHVELAGEFGAGVIIGLIRGGVTDKSRHEETLHFFKESLNELCKEALNRGVVLFLEPINRYETSLLPTLESAAGLIREIGLDNIKILMDTFHMNIEEADIYKAIEKYGSLVGHVHLADSNRLAPGSGHIDFAKVLKYLEIVEYNGFLSFEILPVPSVEEAARDAIKHINGIMNGQF